VPTLLVPTLPVPTALVPTALVPTVLVPTLVAQRRTRRQLQSCQAIQHPSRRSQQAV